MKFFTTSPEYPYHVFVKHETDDGKPGRKWEDLGEGPLKTRADARDFIDSEVGVPAKIVVNARAKKTNPAKAPKGVRYSYIVLTGGGIRGNFATRKQAAAFAKELRRDLKARGDKHPVTIAKDAHVPAGMLSKRQAGNPSKSIRLTNFSGTVRQLSDGTVRIAGRGKRR